MLGRADPRRCSCSSSRARPSRSCRSSCSGTARSRSRSRPCSWPRSGSSRRSCSCRAGSRSSAGSSATVSGYQMLPLLGGLIFSAVASGQIVSRTGRYRLLMFGALVADGRRAVHAHATCAPTRRIPVLWAWMFVTGLGVGPTFAVFPLIVQNSVPVRAARRRDQQPDLLPAGRRARSASRSRARSSRRRSPSELPRQLGVGGRPARGRSARSPPAGGLDAADRRRRPRGGDPGGPAGRRARRRRAVRAGDRRRDPPRVLDRDVEHVPARDRGRRRGRRARAAPPRGAGPATEPALDRDPAASPTNATPSAS